MNVRSGAALFIVGSVMLSGCSDSSNDIGFPLEPEKPELYSVDIRYTKYGVPHITAKDYGSLGYGVGYDHARNNLCTLSEQLMKLKSQKSQYFGPGEQNLNLATDIGYKALDYPAQAAELFDELSDTSRELLEGYAAGFNRSLAERQGPAEYPSPCRGAEWVEPISAQDLLAYQLDIAGLASSRNFITAIAAAVPPVADAAPFSIDLDPEKVFAAKGLGSNGWALGKDMVEGANSLLLGNPHFPWDGELRFYQNHLTIPGELNVNGVTMIGLPAVVIGFNKDLGWTHTVSQSKRFTLYELELDETNPTRYKYDDEYRNLRSKVITVAVKTGDGRVVDYPHTVYFSHHGPVVNLESLSPDLGWDENSAIVFRDANAGNIRMLDQWLAMAKADSREAFLQSFEEHQGIPWVNTVMADKSGRASYIDATRVPNLSVNAEQYWLAASQSPVFAPLWQDGAGSILLPGNSSLFEWVDTGDTLTPGLVPFANAPKLHRDDYVFNSNSSHWLSNLKEPLEGYSIAFGPEQTVRSTRTRYNAQLITDTSFFGPVGPDGKFTLDELKDVLTDNGSLFGGEWKNLLTQRCTGTKKVNYEGADYDLTPACQALIGWDGSYNSDSTGAHLMREFLAAFRVPGHREVADSLFETEFDPRLGAMTPSGLAPIDPTDAKNDPVLLALASAAARLEDRGIALDAALRDLQYVIKAEGEDPIPVSGGYSFEGVFSMAETDGPLTSISTSELANIVIGRPTGDTLMYALDENGDGSETLAYRVNAGSSFVLALQYTDEGPEAEMFLSYSQDHDPEAEHFKDQTLLYSELLWRPVLFNEEDIDAATVDTIELRQ